MAQPAQPHRSMLIGMARYNCTRIVLLMFLLLNTCFRAPNALVAAVILESMSNSSAWSIVRFDPKYLNVGEKEMNLLVPSMSNESCGR